ncbi:Zn-dependent exopeptidase [Podospora conica]|nr:Zn-dependent exopeptidase [Schizothecium conicum]
MALASKPLQSAWVSALLPTLTSRAKQTEGILIWFLSISLFILASWAQAHNTHQSAMCIRPQKCTPCRPPMASLRDLVDKFRPNIAKYEEVYRQLHQNPDLSLLESETARLAEAHLVRLGFDQVITNIGGHGIAGVLRNGSGPTVMLRADMDALPIKELTGLPYASTKTQLDRFGQENPVMHACGHDVHVACLMGCADLMYAARETWSGTLICVFQPGEENAGGARLMVEDGLFSKIPKPDVLLGQHVVPTKAGTLQIRSGPALSARDGFDVRLFGKGGHGSSPQKCIDPVYAACSTVVRLQGIVSREVDPAEFAVVTCVYLQTSKAVNIIPDTVVMKVEVRTYDPSVREQVVAAVQRVIRGESAASGLVKEPEIVHSDDVPAVNNDDKTVKTLEDVFRRHFGNSSVSEMARDTASDDFSVLAEAGNIPCAYWNIGGVDPSTWEKAKRNGTIGDLPSNHSAHFAPAVSPTIQTGIEALAVASLAYLVPVKT